ncbi:MAG: transposase [Myxococcales bacterium]|nr:transposase [Myxococcales bacterium]
MAAGSGSKRTRGPNKQKPWSRSVDDGLSLLRLAIDTSDPVQRARLEGMYSAAHSIRRAVQRDARDRCLAYRSAHHERERGPAEVRARLGLSRTSLEHAAYDHLDGAPHLRRHVTKALAMHLADTVWSATERHLFRDARGKTHGLPGTSRWHEFTRIPGRARSHTKPRKWETFRLHGTWAGHRAAYTGSDGVFVQPRTMRGVAEPVDSWWTHDGPLVLVFTGLPAGDLVLPVRLPASPSNQPILDHHLADPTRWHKIDLVRSRDPNAAGGWRYEAHLMVLVSPYVAPSVAADRAVTAEQTRGRHAGIDVNVSNLTVASFQNAADLTITRVERDGHARQRSHRRARQERRRQRSLDRSRRAMNAHQYQLSKRQEKRARRREATGLPARQVIPNGPRIARSDGKPLQAYRKDTLSNTYRRDRAGQARDAAAVAQARRDHARQIAGRIVRDHGFTLTVEDCDLRPWSMQWGRSLAAFSPGTLLDAIEREAIAVARIANKPGVLQRASTQTTALSQHCLCGARVAKTLADRVHSCPACGLRGDRDAVSAVLAACVVFGTAALPATARVEVATSRALLDYAQTHSALRDTLTSSNQGRQDVPSESTAHSAHDGPSVVETGRTPTYVRWLGETLARCRVQPQMRRAHQARPRWNECEREPTWPSNGIQPWTPLRDSS